MQRSTLNSFFKLQYSHTRREWRECNSFAHNLVKYAIDISDFIIWMEDVPPHVSTVLQADLVKLS